MTDLERDRSTVWRRVLLGAAIGIGGRLLSSVVVDALPLRGLMFRSLDASSNVEVMIVGARLELMSIAMATIACAVAGSRLGKSRADRALVVASGVAVVAALELAEQGVFYLTPWLLLPVIGMLVVGALLHTVLRAPGLVAIGAPLAGMLVACTYVWLVAIPDEVRADQRRIERVDPSFGTEAYLRQEERRYADEVERIQGVDVADSTSTCRVLADDADVISCTVEVENFGATPPEVIHGRDSFEDGLQLGCRSADEIRCIPAPPR